MSTSVNKPQYSCSYIDSFCLPICMYAYTDNLSNSLHFVMFSHLCKLPFCVCFCHKNCLFMYVFVIQIAFLCMFLSYKLPFYVFVFGLCLSVSNYVGLSIFSLLSIYLFCMLCRLPTQVCPVCWACCFMKCTIIDVTH